MNSTGEYHSKVTMPSSTKEGVAVLHIQQFTVNPVEENTYVMSDEESGEAILVDCGCFQEQEWKKVCQYVDDHRLKLKDSLCTHAHFDHIMGTGYALRDYGLQPLCPSADRLLWQQTPVQVELFLGSIAAKQLDTLKLLPKTPQYIHEGDSFSMGRYTWTTIATPGHTPGGVCFYCKEANLLLSGDTLFCGSVGRTDLPGGNYHALAQAIRDKIFCLPPETLVYSGHGRPTTIDYELNFNPYV